MSKSSLTYWNFILRIGTNAKMSYDQQIRLSTYNAVCAISIALIALVNIFFILMKSYSVLLSLLIIPFLLLALYLNAKQLYNYSKFVFVFFILILIFVLALADRRTGTEYVLIAVGCLSALLFENRSNILLAFLTALTFYIFYSWYDTTHPFVPDPSIQYFLAQNISMSISALIVIIQLLMFRSLINTYSEKLGEANKKVQLVNKELQTTNEELQAQTDQLDFLVQQKSSELQAYIDAININIYSAITNLAGDILKVNKPLIDISGYSEQELVGQNFRMLNAGHHPVSFFKNLMETIHAGKNWRGEIKNKAKDGSFFWIEMVIMPIKSANETTSYFLTLALPITERKESEDKQLASAKLLESIAFRASHNVRGPITRIQGLMNLIENRYIELDELEKIVDHLKVSVKEMDVATTELTQFVNSQVQNDTPTTGG
jgi:PAS domain S-box-containing protein